MVNEHDLEPGSMLIGDKVVPMWEVPYPALVQKFEAIGVEKIREAS
ncbi:MAG: hypothetical protein ACYC6Z_09335 [Thermoleophilia bacterium]